MNDMDNDGDGGNANAAVQAGPQEGALNRARLVLRLFKGDGDALATLDFIQKVDAYALVTRLTDAETAQAVAFAVEMGSRADVWLSNLRLSAPRDAASWDRLKIRLQERFSPRQTASEKAAIVEALKQGKEEDVAAYADRCDKIQYLLERDIPDERKTGDNEDAYLANHQAGVLEKLLRGLREADGFKKAVNSSLHCNTLEEYKQAAIRIEKNSVTAKKTAVVAAVGPRNGNDSDDDDEADTVAQIAALTKKLKFARQNGGKGGNGNGRGGGGGGNNGGKPASPRLCWGCQSPDHMNRDCPTPRQFKKGGKSGGRGGGGNNNANANGQTGNSQGGAAAATAAKPWSVNDLNVFQRRAMELGMIQMGVTAEPAAQLASLQPPPPAPPQRWTENSQGGGFW
jgi:hypothetical protein